MASYWLPIRNSGKTSYSNESSCFLILREGDTWGYLGIRLGILLEYNQDRGKTSYSNKSICFLILREGNTWGFQSGSRLKPL